MNSPPTLKPIRVLLVDDHQSILWGLAKLIEGERPRMEVVGQARNRAETLAVARQTQPDVILLDIELGADNSLDFLPELLKDTHARVLVLTGVRDSDLHDRAILCGARGVVLKDESVDVILTAIEKVHGGELWLDRAATGRIFNRFSQPTENKKIDPEAEKIASLTAREREVITAVVKAGGSTNKKIAARLNMSDHTLRNHLTSIYSKLEVGNRLELFMYAVKHDLANSSPS